jgi:hypothetical protein
VLEGRTQPLRARAVEASVDEDSAGKLAAAHKDKGVVGSMRLRPGATGRARGEWATGCFPNAPGAHWFLSDGIGLDWAPPGVGQIGVTPGSRTPPANLVDDQPAYLYA